MNTACSACDPRYYRIHGFCPKCRRKCECPLYEPRSGMSIEGYEEYKKRWYEQDMDTFLRGFGQQNK